MSETLMSIEQLLTEFENNRGWDSKYRLIIQLGKKLPALSETEKTAENEVQGCESLAWLVIEKESGKYHFKMDSDTRVVKGLMMILSIILQDKNAKQINEIDIDAIFKQLGLLSHLSPSRANGLLAIVDRIKEQTDEK